MERCRYCGRGTLEVSSTFESQLRETMNALRVFSSCCVQSVSGIPQGYCRSFGKLLQFAVGENMLLSLLAYICWLGVNEASKVAVKLMGDAVDLGISRKVKTVQKRGGRVELRINEMASLSVVIFHSSQIIIVPCSWCSWSRRKSSSVNRKNGCGISLHILRS